MNLEQAGKRAGMGRWIAVFSCALFAWNADARCEGWKLTGTRDVGTASPLIRHVEATVSNGQRNVALHVVLFDPKKCTLAVVDNPTGDATLATAMLRHGALAGVNGGYFHPDRTPLGLVISDGKPIHPRETARLLSGILVVAQGKSDLIRPASYEPRRPVGQALQAGPFLVERGKAVPGLNATNSAMRTAVLADEKSVCALLVSDPVTLAELGQILATAPVLGGDNLRVQRAINLDGGSSTGLWIKAEPTPFYLREGKDVRNYLAVIPRAAAAPSK